MEVQVIDSLSTTGVACVAAGELCSALTETIVDLVNRGPLQLAAIHASEGATGKAVSFAKIAYARAVSGVVHWSICVPTTDLVGIVCGFLVVEVVQQPSEIQPDSSSCGVYGCFRLAEWGGAFPCPGAWASCMWMALAFCGSVFELAHAPPLS